MLKRDRSGVRGSCRNPRLRVECLEDRLCPDTTAILGSPNALPWNDDVQAKLVNTGLFTAVDVYDIATVTPSLAQLQQYNSVLVYSDSRGYQNSTLLGNNLADYVDGGGGVVVAVFSNASIPFGGRFATENYWAIIPAFQTQGARLTLGMIYFPDSPILAGVNSFDGGSSSYRSTGTVHPAALRVADWSDGSPLAVIRRMGRVHRVDLNFFPPSSGAQSDFWEQTTDGARFMANALLTSTLAPGDPFGAQHEVVAALALTADETPFMLFPSAVADESAPSLGQPQMLGATTPVAVVAPPTIRATSTAAALDLVFGDVLGGEVFS